MTLEATKIYAHLSLECGTYNYVCQVPKEVHYNRAMRFPVARPCCYDRHIRKYDLDMPTKNIALSVLNTSNVIDAATDESRS